MRNSTKYHAAQESVSGAGVSWRKDGVEMAGGGRTRLGSDGSLLIYNVTAADTGRYECRSDTCHVSRVTSPVPRSQTRQRRTVVTRFNVVHHSNIQSQQPDTSTSRH